MPGYKALLGWLEEFGEVTKVGVEGTSSYGTGLARFLRRKGVQVVEVDRQNRQSRLNQGKCDPLDAVESARADISGRDSGAGKTKGGVIESIRVLVVAKRSARQAGVKAITQMRHLGFTAPDQLHSRLKGLSVSALVAESARLRPTRSTDSVTAATKTSPGYLAHRIKSLDVEIAELNKKIEPLIAAAAPDLLALFGVGPDTAAALLVAAGDNPEGSIQRLPGLTCAVSHQYPPVRVRPRDTFAIIRAAIGRPIAPCGGSSWSGSPTILRPPTISSAE